MPVNDCQRRTATSTKRGSNSMPKQTLPVVSAAISVVPLPRNGSYTCVYRKPKPARNGDEVRQGWGAI